MNAVALVIPEFPASVRSDTYDIEYGRMLGPEWMARSAGWYAPAEAMAEFIVTLEFADIDNVAVRVSAPDQTEATNIAWDWADEELEEEPVDSSAMTLTDAIADFGDGIANLPYAN